MPICPRRDGADGATSRRTGSPTSASENARKAGGRRPVSSHPTLLAAGTYRSTRRCPLAGEYQEAQYPLRASIITRHRNSTSNLHSIRARKLVACASGHKKTASCWKTLPAWRPRTPERGSHSANAPGSASNVLTPDISGKVPNLAGRRPSQPQRSSDTTGAMQKLEPSRPKPRDTHFPS